MTDTAPYHGELLEVDPAVVYHPLPPPLLALTPLS